MSKKENKDSYRDNLLARSEEAKVVRKIVAIILISLTLIFIVGCISSYIYIKSALQPVNPDSKEEIKVEVPMGSSTSDIGSILEENGVIKNDLIFRFYIKFKNESEFQAGEYTFTPSMTLNEIIESLKTGNVMKEPFYKVTIPEGKSIDEIADIYAKKLPFSKKEFLKKVNDKAYIKQLINAYPAILTDDILDKNIRTPLEGYLFAATYNIYDEEPTVESVVESMLDKSQDIFSEYLGDIEAMDLSIHETATMASLIEKEASTKEQRKKIAGVFYNRLEEGMRLQTDPTVLYAIGEHKGKVLLKDLEVDSPYNTYQIEGMPVGPISNFSENSLKAALHPEKSDYMYFLHDDEGNIYYAETHEEHLKLKQQYIN